MAVLKEVKVLWCSLPTPNTKFDPMWCVDAIVDEKTADMFRKKGHTVRENTETSELSIKFKRKCQRKDKKTGKMVDNLQPALVDSMRTPMTDAVGNGSVCNIQYREFDWSFAGKSGVGLELQGVQVIEHVSFSGGDGDEFEDSNSEF